MFGASGITRDFRAIQGQLTDAIAREEVKVENIGLDDILIAFVRRQ